MAGANLAVCIPPRTTHLGQVAIRISNNGVDYGPSGGSFEYIPDFQISHLWPSSAGTNRNEMITVLGGTFRSGSSFLCHFAEHMVRAQLVSSSALHCLTPELAPGMIDFSISSALDGSERGRVLEFLVKWPVHILRAQPSSGPVAGGTTVTILGSGVNSAALSCTFANDLSVHGTLRTSTALGCTSPVLHGPHLQHSLSHSTLTIGAGSEVHGELRFRFYATEILHQVRPSFGSMVNPTLVVIVGSGFMDTEELTCSFGGSLVRGLARSASHVECTAPSKQTGSVSVAVSNNGVDFSPGVLTFLYAGPQQALHVWPSVGPIHGGTVVTINSTPTMSSLLHCWFDNVFVRANHVTSSSVRCVTPSHARGTVTMGVGASAFGDGNAQSMAFRYVEEVKLISVIPSTSSTAESQDVTLVGESFGVTSPAWCAFGSHNTTLASVLSSSLLRCKTPAVDRQLAEEKMTVEVSTNGVDFSMSGVSYQYVRPLTLQRLQPSTGPARGGTVVTVVGQDYVDSEGLSCRVGALKPTPGVWRSMSTIECLMPMHVPGNATLGLSGNRRHFSDPLLFTYTDALGVSRISPSRGPTAGGTSVRLHVIVQGSARVKYCSFGGVLARAHVINSTWMQCFTPAKHRAGDMDVGVRLVEVQVDGQETGQTAVFQYENGISVRTVLPNMGSVHGGTMVEVRGSEFLLEGSMQCKFGTATVHALSHDLMVLTSSLM